MSNKAAVALLYAPNSTPKIQKLKVILVRLGIRIKLVTKDQFDCKVWELLSVPVEEAKAFEVNSKNVTAIENSVVDAQKEHVTLEKLSDLKEEVLVMYNFTNQRLDDLLRGIRAAGLSKVNLKAVVTDTNITWSFGSLVCELMKEHEAMKENK